MQSFLSLNVLMTVFSVFFSSCRDTAGQERFRTITTAYYRGAMVRHAPSRSPLCYWTDPASYRRVQQLTVNNRDLFSHMISVMSEVWTGFWF